MSYEVLPLDLIVDILSRLETKTLLRLRSASKSLYAFIGSPTFIRLLTLRTPNQVMIASYQSGPLVKRIYTLHSEGQLSSNSNPYDGITPLEYPFKSFIIAGSCNGILCVYEFGNGTCLWNPSIRRKVTVPDPPSFGFYSRAVGFGFDPVISDYKILWMSKVGSFVYTLKTRTWHAIASPTTRVCDLNSYQCLFNGALHWVAKRCLSLTPDVCRYYIMAFDLSSEVFSTIELPKPTWETGLVTIIDGCLAVISSKHDTSRIWVRGEHNGTASWSVVYKLNSNPFKGVRRVFQRSANGDLLLHHYSKGIQVYSPVKEMHLWTLQDLNSSSRIVGMSMCAKSLELLDIVTSCEKRKSSGKKKKEKQPIRLSKLSFYHCISNY
ncbi:putative F-box protein At3g10240 [Bidens hawaiensis]|uniref:putative F-box protein At3g10240 n=1 Tax=Bidens hawaiensis TaxID=980011 RepID=UPI00404AE06F